ncbi:MAG TPA: DUF1508 domain-containing protein [Kofleriaceae bacterium]|nr:DUF1508 domain-containing protein [Kofleriaceae bacterium]
MRIAPLFTALVLSFSSLAAVGCATTGSDEYGDADAEAAGAGKLTFWQSTDGQWRFNLKSGNGSILLTSEAYSARTGAINGALSVLENGVDPAQYRVVPATRGYIVHLVAANNEIISFSEVYSTKSNATRAVTSCVRAVTSYLDKREALSTGARAEVVQGESGQFHFNFFARNGQIVLSSEAYTTEAAAYNGAMAVQADGQSAAAYTINQNATGGFYFVVKAQNGEIIGTSQQYTTKDSAQSAATAVQALLPSITVL